jgi:hypothetical protein
MAKNQEQKIIVLTEFSEGDHVLIQHGIKLAYIFKKELCLVFNRFTKKDKAGFKEQLYQYAQKIKAEFPELRVSTLLLQGKKMALPDVLAENHEGILIVANALQFKRYAAGLAESSIPFIFVHPESEITDYNRLIQPLDLRKENSDGSLWCSYFGRYNRAEIVMVAANDKSKEGKQNVAKNVVLSRKLYDKFNIKHTVYKGSRSSFRNSFEVLEHALASDCNLFVLLGSSSITPLDYLVGLPERKIINKAGKLPVMVINPRRDNYILCD